MVPVGCPSVPGRVLVAYKSGGGPFRVDVAGDELHAPLRLGQEVGVGLAGMGDVLVAGHVSERLKEARGALK